MTKLPHFCDWTKASETALAPSSPLLALQEEQSIAWAPIHSQSEAQGLTLTLQSIYSVIKPPGNMQADLKMLPDEKKEPLNMVTRIQSCISHRTV